MYEPVELLEKIPLLLIRKRGPKRPVEFRERPALHATVVKQRFTFATLLKFSGVVYTAAYC